MLFGRLGVWAACCRALITRQPQPPPARDKQSLPRTNTFIAARTPILATSRSRLHIDYALDSLLFLHTTERLCVYCRSHANRRHPNTIRNDTSLASSVLQLVHHAPTTYETFVISVKLRRKCTSSHVALCSAQSRASPCALDRGLSCPRSVSVQYSQYRLC